jgi:hypothetical protein
VRFATDEKSTTTLAMLGRCPSKRGNSTRRMKLNPGQFNGTFQRTQSAKRGDDAPADKSGSKCSVRQAPGDL